MGTQVKVDGGGRMRRTRSSVGGGGWRVRAGSERVRWRGGQKRSWEIIWKRSGRAALNRGMQRRRTERPDWLGGWRCRGQWR